MALITHRNQSGFSFFEIIVVMVLIGVFAVVVIVRHTYKDPTLMAQTQILKAHIRYAQMRALSSDSHWGIKYLADDDNKTYSYWLFKQPATETKIVLPGETKDHVRLDETGTAISQGSFEVEFDSWGRPSSSLSGDGTLILNLIGMVPTPEARQRLAQHNADFKRALQPHLTGGVYMNFLEGDEARTRTQDAYTPEAYARLAALKAKYDPDNRFRFSFNLAGQ
jgi:MSHA pilin protein MshC